MHYTDIMTACGPVYGCWLWHTFANVSNTILG
jgi:hypothetical protein